jgi:hypothetical protein
MGPQQPRPQVQDRIPDAPPRGANLETPHRPHPAANAWPDDAVTLTYAELRRLVALHLDLARNQMPNTQPWGWVKERARAMRDGETPLLLSEVMEP